MMLPLIAGLGVLSYLSAKKGLPKPRSKMTSAERNDADNEQKIAVYDTVILTLGEKIDSLHDALRVADDTIHRRDESYDKQLQRERQAFQEREELHRKTLEELGLARSKLEETVQENERLRAANEALAEDNEKLAKRLGRRRGRSTASAPARG